MNTHEPWEQELEDAPFAKAWLTEEKLQRLETGIRQAREQVRQQKRVKRLVAGTASGVAVAAVAVALFVGPGWTWVHGLVRQAGNPVASSQAPHTLQKPWEPIDETDPKQVIKRWIMAAQGGNLEEFEKYTEIDATAGEKMTKAWYAQTLQTPLFEQGELESLVKSPPRTVEFGPNHEVRDTVAVQEMTATIKVEQMEPGTPRLRPMEWKLQLYQDAHGKWQVEAGQIPLYVPVLSSAPPVKKGPVERIIECDEGGRKIETWHDLVSGKSYISNQSIAKINDQSDDTTLVSRSELDDGSSVYIWAYDPNGKLVGTPEKMPQDGGPDHSHSKEPIIRSAFDDPAMMKSEAMKGATRSNYNGRPVLVVMDTSLAQSTGAELNVGDPNQHTVPSQWHAFYYDEETGLLLKKERFVNGIPHTTTFEYQYLTEAEAGNVFEVPKLKYRDAGQ